MVCLLIILSFPPTSSNRKDRWLLLVPVSSNPKVTLAIRCHGLLYIYIYIQYIYIHISSSESSPVSTKATSKKKKQEWRCMMYTTGVAQVFKRFRAIILLTSFPVHLGAILELCKVHLAPCMLYSHRMSECEKQTARINYCYSACAMEAAATAFGSKSSKTSPSFPPPQRTESK